MPKTISVLTLAVAAILLGACSRNVELPKGTALGDLVKVESKDTVSSDKNPVKPKEGETLYVLNFENVGSVAFQDLPADSKSVLHNSPLVDSTGKEYRPAAFGATAADGAFTTEGLAYSGNMEAKDGRFYMQTGKVDVPGGKLTVVYSVPKTASGLALRDGDKKHPIQ